MNAVLTASSHSAAARHAIRVMVVDDSVVMRGLVNRWLQEEPGIEVVASLRNGREAVDQVEHVDPDVVILDIEMPGLDGLAALPLLLAKKRDLVVIMASMLTRRHAEVSLRALALGATDYIPKPETNRGVSTSADFRRELIEKIRQIGGRRARRRNLPALPMPLRNAPPLQPESTDGFGDRHEGPHPYPALVPLRTGLTKLPRALLIGASTGGPQALTSIVSQLGPLVRRVPVLIVQHMPPTFTTILCEHLSRVSGHLVREPSDGETVLPGIVHLAPGGSHMLVARQDGVPVIRLDQGPPVNFCRPAVDPLFASAAEVWSGAVLAVILTGMGHDGTAGGRAIVASGGVVVAQDEASSVIWGMPGSAAHAGICSALLPLDQIAPRLVRMFAGDFT